MGLCLWQNKLCQVLDCLLVRDETYPWTRWVNKSWTGNLTQREASVLTEVQYSAGSWPLTTEPRPCKLPEKWQVSTTLKASSTRMPVCHAWRRIKMMSTKAWTPSRARWTHLNPVTPNEPLSNIASGVKPTDDIVEHLLTAEQKGNDAFTTFVEKRLDTSDVDLFAQLPNYRRSKIWSCQRKPKLKVISSSRLTGTCLPGWTS